MFSKNIPDDNKEQSGLNYVRSKMPEIIDKFNACQNEKNVPTDLKQRLTSIQSEVFTGKITTKERLQQIESILSPCNIYFGFKKRINRKRRSTKKKKSCRKRTSSKKKKSVRKRRSTKN